MKRLAILLCLGGLLVLAVAAVAQEPGKGFLWDGTHWQQISTDGKVGYVWGIGNLADFEVHASKGRAPCASQAFVEGLKNQTPQQVVATVDKYYADNPGKLGTTVLEVILMRCTTVCPPELLGGEKKK